MRPVAVVIGVAARHVAVAIAVMPPMLAVVPAVVGRRLVAAAIIARRALIARPPGRRGLAVDRIRRESTGTGVGRALVDVVILRLRLGETLIAPASAAG